MSRVSSLTSNLDVVSANKNNAHAAKHPKYKLDQILHSLSSLALNFWVIETKSVSSTYLSNLHREPVANISLPNLAAKSYTMKSLHVTLLYASSILVPGALALPSPNPATYKIIAEVIYVRSHLSLDAYHIEPNANTEQFDERSANPATPLLNPVGVDKGLYFQSWVLVNSGTQVLGLRTHSPEISIVTANEQRGIDGTPTITSIYSGSKTKLFDLKSFYFGCLGNDVAAAGNSVAVQCTVLSAGFKGNQEIVVASYTFTPTVSGLVQVPMIQAVLPVSFVGL